MQKKVRLCRGCGNEGNLVSGFCEVCNGVGFISPAPRVPKSEEKPTVAKNAKVQIKPRSDKRTAEMREYLKMKEVFLKQKGEEHDDGLPRCEGQFEGCTGIAEVIQHSIGKENGRLLDVEYWKASCVSCNGRAESHPWEAQATGFSLLRGEKR